MRICMLALLILPWLSGCQQWCDCQNTTQSESQVHSMDSPTAGEPLAYEDDFAIASMPEAKPVESKASASQLDQLLTDPNAKPIPGLAVSVKSQSQTAPFIRRALPSEINQMWSPAAVMNRAPYTDLPKSRKQVQHYAAQTALKLADFVALRGAKVAVTSFVEFDESLERTTALGNQFAEAMVSALPSYGVQVIEYKLSRNLQVGQSGDLVLSRDVKRLHQAVAMDYVLTGTLVATRLGVQIHSRVVSVSDQSVIASTSTLIPHAVLQQIQP